MRANCVLWAVVAATLSLVGISHAAEADRLPNDTGDGRGVNRAEMLYSQVIIGERVTNERDQAVGTIKELLINPDSGKVEFAVVAVSSGFLGMGEKTSVIPWQQFRLNPTRHGYVLSANRPAPAPKPAPEPRPVEEKPPVTTPPLAPSPSVQPTNETKPSGEVNQSNELKQFSGKITAMDVAAGKILVKGKLGNNTFNCGLHAELNRFKVGDEVDVDYREQYGLKMAEAIRPATR